MNNNPNTFLERVYIQLTPEQREKIKALITKLNQKNEQ